MNAFKERLCQSVYCYLHLYEHFRNQFLERDQTGSETVRRRVYLQAFHLTFQHGHSEQLERV